MRILKVFFIFLFTNTLTFQLIGQEYVAPDLEFICDLKVTIDTPSELGETPRGKRVIIPISGGTFEGPYMKGIVLRGGADYQYVNTEMGRTELEAIYTIKTDDSIYIHVRNIGLIYNPKEDKTNNSPEKTGFYFRAAPKFEAPTDSKYAWLNNAIYICKPVPQKDYISIQVWKVL